MTRDRGFLCFLCSAWLALLVGLTGCEKATPVMKASASFSAARGIQPGAAVTLNGVAIGKVSAVEPAGQGVLVRLELEPAKANVVQQNATASLVTAAGQTLVALNNPPQPAAPIADGAVLQALEPSKGLGELIGEVVGTVKETLQQAKDYFNTTNKQWQDAKNDMQKSLESVAEQSKTAGKELQQDLDKLLKDLESQARSTEAEAGAVLGQVRAEYEALDASLVRKGQELQAEGKAEAVAKMKALRARLKSEVDRFQAQTSP